MDEWLSRCDCDYTVCLQSRDAAVHRSLIKQWIEGETLDFIIGCKYMTGIVSTSVNNDIIKIFTGSCCASETAVMYVNAVQQ